MKMLIGGELVDSSNHETRDLVNPANMEVIDQVPMASKEDVNQAIEYALEGFQEWSNISLGRRIEILREFARIYQEREEELAQLLVGEVGKPIRQARFFVDETLEGIDTYIEQARFIQGTAFPEGNRPVREGDLIVTVREPLGVVVCITPFNYPITMLSMKVIPALVMGNSVIVKPATNTPRANLLFCQWLIEAGVPPKAVQLVTGTGETVGNMLTQDPRIAKVTLTGSTEVGIQTAQSCAKNLVRASLELGGNDPFVILKDCDFNRAVEEAYNARIQNSGQTCIAPKRLIVHNDIKEKFIQAVIERLKTTIVGDPADEKTDMGPVVSQKAAMEVERQIQHTIEQGGILRYGGHRYNECFIEPTVIEVSKDTDVATDMEIFGPVFSVIGFDTIDEALAIANNTKYGLNAGVIGNNMSEVMYVAKRIQAGSVVMNGCGCLLSKEQPFGGWKMSGNACREGGKYVLEDMSQLKTLFFHTLY